MSRQKRKSPWPDRQKAAQPPSAVPQRKAILQPALAAQIILLLFGVSLSILYFGHQAVPNSDFPAFVKTAQDVLHFHPPASFKRLPGLGLLQIALSCFVKGPCPILTAGLLLNAILYPLCGWLLFRIAQRILGRGAFWFALTALVNPFVLAWLVHPIAEIPLIFFFLLTFYLLFEKGRWAYAAAFAASMIRYEGAVLIALVFMRELLAHRTLRQRLLSAGLAFLAGLPVSLWILGQILSHKSGGGDYLSSYRAAAEGEAMVFGQFARLLRQVTIGPYFQPNPASSSSLVWLSSILLWVGLLAAGFFAVWKKHPQLIAIFSFTAIYFLLHAARTGTRPRYAVPIAWLVFLLWLYGCSQIWHLFRQKITIPKPALLLLEGLICLVCLCAAFSRLEPLAQMQKYSPRSAPVPWIALGAAVLFGAIELLFSQKRDVGWTAAVLGVTCWALFANQAYLIQNLGNGAVDQEFKELAIWYLKNASKNEKLVTTMPHLLELFAPSMSANFVHTRNIAGSTPEEFVEDCRRKKITYLAWDSRLGLAFQNSYYKLYGLDRIAYLGPRLQNGNKLVMPPSKNGPFELVGTIRNHMYPQRFILIYRLSPSSN